MKRLHTTCSLAVLAALTACGREPEKPFEPLRADDPQAPARRIVSQPHAPETGLPPSTLNGEDFPSAPLEAPRPEAGLPPATALSAEEVALVGTYRLREFIAMSGQVPGPDARLNGSIVLRAAGRRVTLYVAQGALSNRYVGGGDHTGGGRWRLAGDEVVFDPFVVDKGEPLVGPWVARWQVVREDGQVLLKAGEFTYERVPEK
jgi:hypothetical protein